MERQLDSILIWSRVLGCEVWLVPGREALGDLEAAGEVGDRPVFFFKEVERLRGKDEAELRAIAATKRVFGPKAIVKQ